MMLSSTCFTELHLIWRNLVLMLDLYSLIFFPVLSIPSNQTYSKASSRVDSTFVSCITNYLTERPQFVRLENCVSGTLMSSTGAPQGTLMAPFLFTHIYIYSRLQISFWVLPHPEILGRLCHCGVNLNIGILLKPSATGVTKTYWTPLRRRKLESISKD